MENILILGKGYISSKIQKYWNLKDFNLIFVSRSEFDYTDTKTLYRLIDEHQPKYLINCYGFTGKPNVDSCEEHEEECFKRNYHDALNIAYQCRITNTSFITISTGCVYNDETGERIFYEGDYHNFGHSNPTASVYSRSKSIFEQSLAIDFSNFYLLRIRMPFDSVMDDKNYINKIIKYDKLVNYKNSVTYIPDLVKFIEIIVQNKAPCGIYNVVNDGGITAEEVIGMYNETTGKNKNVNRWYSTDDLLTLGMMKCRRSNCVLSTDKIKKYFPELLTSKEAISKSIQEWKNGNEK